MGTDHINHKPVLLALFIANKILNRHLIEAGSKSMVERRGWGSGRVVASKERDTDKIGKRKK